MHSQIVCLFSHIMHKALVFATNDPDIVCFSETWFHNDVADTEFTPPGYTCFRKDRRLDFYTAGTYQQEGRGGVCTIAKTSLKPIILSEGETDAEIL